MVKATKNYHYIGTQVIFIIIITCNRPQICLYSTFETFTCAAGDYLKFCRFRAPKDHTLLCFEH